MEGKHYDDIDIKNIVLQFAAIFDQKALVWGNVPCWTFVDGDIQ